MQLPTSPHSTKVWTAVCLAAASSVAACQNLVTTVPLSDQLVPLDMALSDGPETIEARANSGDGQAQIAMVIVSAYGLGGRKPDVVAASQWQEQAQTNRRFMPITQYTAAFNGSPSRVNIINVPIQAISAAQWQAVDRCVALLSGEAARDQSACGDAEQSRRRQVAWRQSIVQ